MANGMQLMSRIDEMEISFVHKTTFTRKEIITLQCVRSRQLLFLIVPISKCYYSYYEYNIH